MTLACIASAQRKPPRATVCRVSIPLTLGVPSRPDPGALVAGLLQQRCRSFDDVRSRHAGVSAGPPVLAASFVRDLPSGTELGRVVVQLDIDPDELRAGSAVYEAVRFQVDVDSETVEDAVRLRLPSPLVIFPDPTEASVMDVVTLIVDANRTPGFTAAASPRHIADVLAVVAHSDVGVSTRARDGEDVLAILAATVAALRGDDIPTALATPDLAGLARLRPEAAEAVRSVLLGIEIDDAEAAHRGLIAAGLIRT